jgi:N-acetylglucosaminyl-diphospho-decaprenol L-rhamnosyltransferase
MVPSAKIDIVIPTYNGVNTITRLLDSIRKQTYSNYNCFVIDDFSKDNTVATIKANYPWVHLTAQTENKGSA